MKQLSYILRHTNLPNEQGWVDVDVILKECKLTKEALIKIVKDDNKNRYELQENKIRARQGHSINVSLEFKECKPPRFLYHGTNRRNFFSIVENGIKPMQRQFVHLSKDIATAENVAKRYGKDFIILKVDTEKLTEKVFISTNNVYLTKWVTPKSIIELL